MEMKNVKFMFMAMAVILGLGMVSCGDDDDNNKNPTTTNQGQSSGNNTVKEGMTVGYYSSGEAEAMAKRLLQDAVDFHDTGLFNQMKNDVYWEDYYGFGAYHVVDNQTIEFMLQGISMSEPVGKKYYRVTDGQWPFYVYFDFDSSYSYSLDGENLTINSGAVMNNQKFYYRNGNIVAEAQWGTATYKRIAK